MQASLTLLKGVHTLFAMKKQQKKAKANKMWMLYAANDVVNKIGCWFIRVTRIQQKSLEGLNLTEFCSLLELGVHMPFNELMSCEILSLCINGTCVLFSTWMFSVCRGKWRVLRRVQWVCVFYDCHTLAAIYSFDLWLWPRFYALIQKWPTGNTFFGNDQW